MRSKIIPGLIGFLAELSHALRFCILVATVSLAATASKAQDPAEGYRIKVSYLRKDADGVNSKLEAFESGQSELSKIQYSIETNSIEDSEESRPRIEIVAPDDFEFKPLMELVSRFVQQKFELIEIKAVEGLQWEVFEPGRFESIRRRRKTAVLSLMADLCPGCRKLRNSLWESKKVLKELADRDVVLLVGNAAYLKGLKEFTKKEFDQKLPAFVISCPGMGEAPEILKGIPSEEAALKAIKEKLPAKSKKEKRQR